MTNIGVAGLVIGLLIAVGGSAYYFQKSNSAYSFAQAHGCQLNEGKVNPCVVDGKDYGRQLYNDGASFLYIFATFTFGAIIALVGLVMFIVGVSRSRKVVTVTPQSPPKIKPPSQF